MVRKYNSISLTLGVPGIVLQIVGIANGHSSPFGDPLLLLGTILLLVGFAYYAKAKSRSPLWCLVAFLGIIGLIVLASLKDHDDRPGFSEGS